jgi:hypothetical protein
MRMHRKLSQGVDTSWLPLTLILFANTALTGCISYTVGQSAETTAMGERSASSSINLVNGTLKSNSDTISTTRPSVDNEMRFGIDNRSDIGLRVTSFSGFMVSWKRQLSRPDSSRFIENRSRTSLMLGGGVLNLASHAALEATLITSGPWSTAGQWYSAARVIQVAPIRSGAKNDDPTFGVVMGYLFGNREQSVGPEIGVYYDRSVLGLNKNRVLVIPSIVIRGDGLPFFGRLF